MSMDEVLNKILKDIKADATVSDLQNNINQGEYVQEKMVQPNINRNELSKDLEDYMVNTIKLVGKFGGK